MAKNYFNPDKEFFIIDSDSLSDVKDRLYGFCVIDDKYITNEADLRRDPDGAGAYIYIKNRDGKIYVTQDFIGCWGIYIYIYMKIISL